MQRRSVPSHPGWMLERALHILDDDSVKMWTVDDDDTPDDVLWVRVVFGCDKPRSGMFVIDEDSLELRTDKSPGDLTPTETADLYGQLVRKALEFRPENLIVQAVERYILPSAVALGIRRALFEPDDFKTDAEAYRGPKEVYVYLHEDADEDAFLEGDELGRLCNLARWLGHLPCQPGRLDVEGYVDLVERLMGHFEIDGDEPIVAEYRRMGLLAAVSRGSNSEGRVLRLTLHPESGETTDQSVRIGKGLVFDSGGVQDKGEHMPGMQLDMMGSAVMLAEAIYFARHRDRLARTTHWVLAIAENRDGKDAYLPNEILTSYKGLTVEVTHTDAEGRLVMADAMAWACHEVVSTFNGKIGWIVTAATLTGACANALGVPYTGLFFKGDNPSDIAEFMHYGRDAGDLVWPLPASHPHYAEQMKSDRADLRNTGKEKPGGASQAAAFLMSFLPDDYEGEFIHLDIAGSTDIEMKGGKTAAKGLPQAAGLLFLIELDRAR